MLWTRSPRTRDQDEQHPLIGYRYPEDRRADLKQVQAGLAASADGGIPVHACVFGGGAGRGQSGRRGDAGSVPPGR
ncbi:hypothetical protein ACWGKW_25230 [Streptomyces sp. NPDC054766]